MIPNVWEVTGSDQLGDCELTSWYVNTSSGKAVDRFMKLNGGHYTAIVARKVN